MLIGDISLLAIFLGIGFFSVLNGLRFYRYGKLVIIHADLEGATYEGPAAFYIMAGILFMGVSMLGLLGIFRPIGIAIDIILIIVFVTTLNWYWHTKEDPFAFDKVWEDPRDKKKQEPK